MILLLVLIIKIIIYEKLRRNLTVNLCLGRCTIVLAFAVILTSTFMFGCGQKGELYQPTETQKVSNQK